MDLLQLGSYLDWLGSVGADQVTQWFLSLILVVFVAAVALLTFPLVVRQLRLRSMRRRLLKAGTTALDLSETQREDLEAGLQRSAWSMRIWGPFLSGWNELYDAELKQAAQPVDFLDFCTPDRVIPGVANRRLATAVPGILVALGILGTFLGLTLGLPQETGLTAADPTVINRLIGGLRTAFTTSLVGIGASLVYLAIDRVAIQVLERGVRRLGDATARFYPSLSPQALQRRDARQRTETTAQLKTLATDIAVALENSMGSVMREAVGEAMQKEIAPILQNLQGAVSRLGEVVSGDMADALRSFSDQINDNVSNVFEKSFTDLTGNLAKVVETQDGMRELLGTLAARAREQAQIQERLTGRVIAAADALGGLIESLTNIADRLQAASDSVNTATKELLEASHNATESQKAIAAAHEGLAERIREDLVRLEEARSGILNGWKAVASEASDSIAIVQGAVQQLGDAVGDNLLQALGSFDEKLAEVTTRFSGTLHEVRETIHELPELLTTMTKSAEEMSNTTKSLSANVRDLVEELQSSVGDSTQRAQDAATRLSETTERAAKVATDFNGVIERYTSALAGMDDLSRSASAIAQQLGDRENQELQQIIDRLDKLGEMQTSVQDIGRHAEELVRSVRDVEQSSGGLRGLFGRR